MDDVEEAVGDTAKGFVQDIADIVSLVRTLAELFSSASDIYRDLKKKKKDKKDSDSDSEKHKHRHRKWLIGRRDSSSSSSSSDSESKPDQRGIKHKKKEAKKNDTSSDEESIKSSAAILRAEYEHGYGRLGRRYAVGDLIAQNQLQAQIIALQQTIIRIHQQRERLHPKVHVIQLIQTARSARTASTQALAGLYRRMLSETESPMVPGAFPEPPHHTHTTNELIIRKRHCHQNRPKSLYCPYALALQEDIYQPLTRSFLKGGNRHCPHCKHHILIRPGKSWEIILEDPRRCSQVRAFLISNRFLVRCHTAEGRFACVLCSKFRETDTTCGEIADLVDHIWKDHEVRELEDDEDVRAVGRI